MKFQKLVATFQVPDGVEIEGEGEFREGKKGDYYHDCSGRLVKLAYDQSCKMIVFRAKQPKHIKLAQLTKERLAAVANRTTGQQERYNLACEVLREAGL